MDAHGDMKRGALYAYTILESVAGDHVVRPLASGNLWATDVAGTVPDVNSADLDAVLESCNFVVGTVAFASESYREPSVELSREALRLETRIRACCRLLMLRARYNGRPSWFPELQALDSTLYRPLVSELENLTGFVQTRRSLAKEYADALVEAALRGSPEAIEEVESWAEMMLKPQPSGFGVCETLKVYAIKSLDSCREGRAAGKPDPAETPRQASVFVSYRRQDSGDFVGRLCAELKADARTQVLLDVDSIQLGADFRESIRQQIEESDAVLVVIGPGWVRAAHEDGSARLMDEMDVVRVEVETALTLGKRIVPILAGGAAMPAPSELPESISTLSFRNGIQIRHESFGRDVAELAEQLSNLVLIAASEDHK